jgi:hypothetical protein
MFLSLRKRTPVAELVAGEERIVEGKVVCQRELTVPGTKIKCAWYYLLSEAWQHGPRGRGRKMWVPKNVQVSSEGFFLEDESGRVWVDAGADGAEVSGGTEESDVVGKKGRQRYLARVIRGVPSQEIRW